MLTLKVCLLTISIQHEVIHKHAKRQLRSDWEGSFERWEGSFERLQARGLSTKSKQQH